MTLEGSKDNRIDLKFSGGSNLNQEKDPYMHSLSIDFVDENKIVQNWTMYDAGEEKSVSSFTLSRANWSASVFLNLGKIGDLEKEIFYFTEKGKAVVP